MASRVATELTQRRQRLREPVMREPRPSIRRAADATGITMVHLSHDFDADAAEEASLELSRRYRDGDDYFRLK